MLQFFSIFHRRPRTTMVLALIWTLLIFIGCSLPGKEIPKIGLFAHFDKLVHFVFFFVFFLLWKISRASLSNSSFIILILAITYGFSLEFYQMYFVAGRSFDTWDGIADTIGAVSGLLFYNKIK
ncbi:MAG TPA: VanZ family protein [Chitinophagaceae bacterium]|nr:VanZ family protein [Chitinophagaceae bacterium]